VGKVRKEWKGTHDAIREAMMHVSRTPRSVVAAAVCLFVYGALLLVCVTCSHSFRFTAQDPDHPGADADAVLQARLDRDAPGNTVVSAGTAAADLVFAFVLFLSGLGVLRLMPIARIAAYAVCVCAILLAVAGSAYQILVIVPIHEQLLAQNRGLGIIAPEITLAWKVGTIIRLLIAVGIALLLGVCSVILLSVESARAAFAGKFDEPLRDNSRPRFDDDEHNFPSRGSRSPPDTGITDRL
jgi:hypothetical protein